LGPVTGQSSLEIEILIAKIEVEILIVKPHKLLSKFLIELCPRNNVHFRLFFVWFNSFYTNIINARSEKNKNHSHRIHNKLESSRQEKYVNITFNDI
jgi:hypothetical protein